MVKNFEIRKIKLDEIPLVRDFPPPDWNLDLSKVYRFHFSEKYFYGSIALIGDEIAGTGMVIFNRDIAWLGTIIVKEKFRNKGIGKAITEHLIDRAKDNGARNIILVASSLGLPVYERIGFRQSMNYLIFNNGTFGNYHTSNSILKIDKEDLSSILSLDKEASGENRKMLIEKTYLNGFKYVSDKRITGYYLPEFGKGLIVAVDKLSGLELMKFKYSIDKSRIVVPESNKIAIDFLLSHGFSESLKVPRMYLGTEALWKPEMIFCRGSGYLG